METIEEMIENYGIDNFVLALLIIITTGFGDRCLRCAAAGDFYHG